ncbi:hypothetical protein AB0K51_14845 [Kitasatospora sp. NPDC049285]|uniref:hypothetical protein n=1 Tax=Kitasatospora sp. NPDC049285 TaxID=3157096 RepID=UPI00342381BA
MIRTGRTFLAATAAVVALTATATGCGTKVTGDNGAAPSAAGSGSAATGQAAELTPAALLKLAGEKTSAAKSAKVDAVTEVGAAKTSMKGAISWDHGLQGELTGTADAMAKAAAKFGGDGTFTARYLSDAMYINMGDGFANQLGGAHWIKYDYANLAKTMGAAGEGLKNQLQNADPVASMQALIASGKVSKAGTERVNGVQTTKYAGDLAAADLTQAAAQGLTKEQVDGLQRQFTTAGITTEHIEIWVTADLLLVKQVQQFATKAGQCTATASYSDYGTPVATTPPSASDTMDFAQLLQSSMAGS